MFNQFFDLIVLRFRIARQLRLERQLKALKERIDLKSRFPQHGRYVVGGFEVNRFDRSGGYDTVKFFKDNEQLAEQLHTPKYTKARVESVTVRELRREHVK